MIDLDNFRRDLAATPLEAHTDVLCALVSRVIAELKHGDQQSWDAALEALPQIDVPWPSLFDDTVSVGNNESLPAEQRIALEKSLRAFMPWRKGPYAVAGIIIDTEWRSDWKWNRLAADIQPLAGRTVLDVGCGNGYHLWRMRAAGAKLAIGIDPTLLFLYQFNVLNHFIKSDHIYILPVRAEQLPPTVSGFDTVFSMGVLYHRREPEQHLRELHQTLRRGGELVLETLVSPDDEPIHIGPGQRYARMRNVWAIPTVSVLIDWLRRCGFHHIELISESQTTVEEQRTTAWMTFESLAESLMPGNSQRTIEDLPAPRRAILRAERLY